MDKIIHFLHPDTRFLKIATPVRSMYGIKLPRWDVLLDLYKSTHYMAW